MNSVALIHIQYWPKGYCVTCWRVFGFLFFTLFFFLFTSFASFLFLLDILLSSFGSFSFSSSFSESFFPFSLFSFSNVSMTSSVLLSVAFSLSSLEWSEVSTILSTVIVVDDGGGGMLLDSSLVVLSHETKRGNRLQIYQSSLFLPIKCQHRNRLWRSLWILNYPIRHK